MAEPSVSGSRPAPGSEGFAVGVAAHVGIFLLALGALAYQILITRVFSVTLYYHFAFAGISLTMLGLTAGAMIVYLAPRFFSVAHAYQRLVWLTLGASVTSVLAMVFHLSSPIHISKSVSFLLQLLAHFGMFAVPFLLTGVGISVILTRGVRSVGRLYAADLVGAALGAVLVVLVLRWVGVVSAILLVALLLAVAAVVFAWTARASRVPTVVFLLICGIALTTQVSRESQGKSHLSVRWAKNVQLETPLYEGWNSYSRVAVVRELEGQPFGWGFGPSAAARHPVLRQYYLNIDAEAGTAILEFDGDTESLAFLEDDVVNVSYHVRRPSRVAVVGVGGGRDVLTALRFDVSEVTGIELNTLILDLLTERYGDFSGRLHEDPRVRFVNAEARSYLAQAGEQFDLIQISLIDTWAATAAGAYVLSENALYTKEAWRGFLQALSADGVLTTSRWWTPGYRVEGHRMFTMALEVLREEVGTDRPEQHILMARGGRVVNVMVSKAPYTADEVERFIDSCNRLEFEVLWSPRGTSEPVINALASGTVQAKDLGSLAFDLTPPTDDRPFFFHQVRLADAFKKHRYEKLYGNDVNPVAQNVNAVFVLAFVLIAVSILSVVLIGAPLLATRGQVSLRGSGAPMGYFAAIGLGFLFVEISQMQRLVVFLGHPVYGLAVVLFALLLFAGLGSLSTIRITRPVRALGVLLAMLLIFGVATVPLTSALRSQDTMVRIVVAVLMLAPLGFCMGMAFPFGMRMVETGKGALLPWFWGVNGATSVVATVLATAVSLSWGITATYWVGVACYVGCVLAYLAMERGMVPVRGRGRGKARARATREALSPRRA